MTPAYLDHILVTLVSELKYVGGSGTATGLAM